MSFRKLKIESVLSGFISTVLLPGLDPTYLHLRLHLQCFQELSGKIYLKFLQIFTRPLHPVNFDTKL